MGIKLAETHVECNKCTGDGNWILWYNSNNNKLLTDIQFILCTGSGYGPLLGINPISKALAYV